ncbi:uncharacterized protein N7496_011218 [Penicillium cataractarum]|uniref:Uncharacterized protein n=1 Tax=Penicillium cataractarum TaxID=2100454 RepID=A0A9W9REK5_9EURO|nr:uncharacterized protein N7496_011218 [Penicillium cataractarum]KAJ5358805.1 hypothetical protein N7496_011218 [Penicillium cataractarum]
MKEISNSTPSSFHSAAQRVFALPELMSKILEYFAGKQRLSSPGNPLGFTDLQSLQYCSLVNKYWHMHAMRLFWGNPTPAKGIPLHLHGYLIDEGPFDTSLVQRFVVVKADRRQFYADLVLEANLMVVRPRDQPWADRLFRGLTFPKLHKLVIYLDQSEALVSIPVIKAPNLSRIEVKLCRFRTGQSNQYVMCGPSTRPPQRQVMAQLAGIIKDRYPGIRRVVFEDGIEISRTVLEKFRKKMRGTWVSLSNHPAW